MKKHASLAVLNYFRVLARLQLLKNRPLIIGVTGSAGKTTMMHALKAVLDKQYTLKVSEKANSQSGLSLNILGLYPTSFSVFDWLRLTVLAPLKLLTNWEKYDAYIAEMGIDSPDEPANMGYLLRIVQPAIGVFTSVNLVHAEAFDKVVSERNVHKREGALLQAIAKEKAKLITGLPSSGFAVYTSDDPVIAQACSTTIAKQLTFGAHRQSTVRLMGTTWKSHATIFTVRHAKEETQMVCNDYLLPEHYGKTLCGAVAVALALKIPFKQAARALSEKFRLPPGRATLIPAINKATILDSSYNSSPAPLADFLDLVHKLKLSKAKSAAFPRRVLGLLGDMRELGKLSGFEHDRAARKAAATLDRAYLVGPAMREHVLPILKKAGIPAVWFSSPLQAAAQLKEDLQPDDLLLVKGSQNTIFLESAVEQLMQNPQEADALLCRRGSFWNKQRKLRFG